MPGPAPGLVWPDMGLGGRGEGVCSVVYRQATLQTGVQSLKMGWWLARFKTDHRIFTAGLFWIEDWDQHNPWHLIKTRMSKMGQITSLMTEIAKFVRFPRIPDFILFISSLGQGFFISWWVNILGPCLLYSKGPFVVRIFGQMAFSPPRPSRWPLLLLFASKAELLPEVCELELAPVLIQILGSDNRVIVIGYSCQISQEVGTLEQYFCIQIRSVDARNWNFLSRTIFF